jgi:hypothetical protein
MIGRLLIVCGLALLGMSCNRTTPGAPDELPILARWVEDQAHGLPRRVGELDLDGASPALQRAAAWVAGDDLGNDRWRPPAPIAGRAARWPAVAAALRSGVLLLDLRQGLVGPAPSLTGDDFTLAATLADAENHDRRRLDVLVLSRAGMASAREAVYLAAAREARNRLDLSAGGKPWVPTTPPPLAR